MTFFAGHRPDANHSNDGTSQRANGARTQRVRTATGQARFHTEPRAGRTHRSAFPRLRGLVERSRQLGAGHASVLAHRDGRSLCAEPGLGAGQRVSEIRVRPERGVCRRGCNRANRSVPGPVGDLRSLHARALGDGHAGSSRVSERPSGLCSVNSRRSGSTSFRRWWCYWESP